MNIAVKGGGGNACGLYARRAGRSRISHAIAASAFARLSDAVTGVSRESQARALRRHGRLFAHVVGACRERRVMGVIPLKGLRIHFGWEAGFWRSNFVNRFTETTPPIPSANPTKSRLARSNASLLPGQRGR
jgi:hypothetical protein